MELIAQGRDADVYALDADRVLRRHRDGGPPTEPEARVMTHLAECGYPVPWVYDVTGTDMVLERLNGPTMPEELARRPRCGPQKPDISHIRTSASPSATASASFSSVRRAASPGVRDSPSRRIVPRVTWR